MIDSETTRNFSGQGIVELTNTLKDCRNLSDLSQYLDVLCQIEQVVEKTGYTEKLEGLTDALIEILLANAISSEEEPNYTDNSALQVFETKVFIHYTDMVFGTQEYPWEGNGYRTVYNVPKQFRIRESLKRKFDISEFNIATFQVNGSAVIVDGHHTARALISILKKDCEKIPEFEKMVLF